MANTIAPPSSRIARAVDRAYPLSLESEIQDF
jgi:hypothetical protein